VAGWGSSERRTIDSQHDPIVETVAGFSPDRRRHQRTSCIASAAVVVVEGAYVGTYVVENISESGALLVGRLQAARDDSVEVILQIGERLSFPVSARVARVEWQTFAVEFQDLSDAMRTALIETVRARPHPTNARRTLVACADPRLQRELAHDLTVLGQTVISFGDAGSAIEWLRMSSDVLIAAFIDPVLEDATPMLRSIQTRFPNAKRILIFDLPTAPRSLKRMIASEEVQSLLYNPWTPLSLTSSLFFGGFPKQSARRCLEATQTGISPP
jgi:PilZ domain-containing protein